MRSRIFLIIALSFVIVARIWANFDHCSGTNASSEYSQPDLESNCEGDASGCSGTCSGTVQGNPGSSCVGDSSEKACQSIPDEYGNPSTDVEKSAIFPPGTPCSYRAGYGCTCDSRNPDVSIVNDPNNTGPQELKRCVGIT